MKQAVGSDEKALLTDFVIEQLKKRGHQVNLFGPVKGEAMGWPDVGERVASEVGEKLADQGVLFCWTRTGVSITANKVPGVRGGSLLGRGDWQISKALGRRQCFGRESQEHIACCG